MTRAAVFSLLPVRPQSTIASVRLASWLSSTLGIPLYDNALVADYPERDVLFIVNGSTLYCRYLEALALAVRGARHVVWVQNDYTLPPPSATSEAQSPFRKAFADRSLVPHYWTTCYENSRKTSFSVQINWNMLGFNAEAPQATLESAQVLYYGAWRVGREKSFDYMSQCFAGRPPLVISSTSQKFDALPNVQRVEPFRGDAFWPKLAGYGLGVYAQDRRSAASNHSPATRLYEMMSVGLPVCFLPDCIPTMRLYKKDAERYELKPDTVDKLIADRNLIAEEQRVWRNDFHSLLALRVKDLYARTDWSK